MNARVLSGTTLALFAAGLIGLAAQAPPAVKRTVLQQLDMSIPGREVVTALAEISANGATGRHTHPGDEVSYILAGPLVVEIDGKPAKTYQTGEAFLIPAGTIHNGKAGASGAKVVANYVIEKGKPATTPVQ